MRARVYSIFTVPRSRSTSSLVYGRITPFQRASDLVQRFRIGQGATPVIVSVAVVLICFFTPIPLDQPQKPGQDEAGTDSRQAHTNRSKSPCISVERKSARRTRTVA